ncbi:hypothetical protein Tco_1546156 [Tanacetum coccineum]
MLIADSLLKTIWLSMHHVVANEALDTPGQTTTGYTFGSGEDSLKFIELMDLSTKLIDKVTILENALKQSKESHVQILPMLMKKLKRLEDKLKFYNTSKKTRMVISDTKEYLISEDSVKQGRMEEYIFEEVYRKITLGVYI